MVRSVVDGAQPWTEWTLDEIDDVLRSATPVRTPDSQRAADEAEGPDRRPVPDPVATRARTYARAAVAPSNPSSKEGASATREPVRRYTKAQLDAKLKRAAPFAYDSPDGPLLEEVVREYERITGVAVRRPRKRNLIAACYRTHGPRFLTLVRRRFAETGTETNLLGDIRAMPVDDDLGVEDDLPRSAWDPGYGDGDLV